MPPSSRPLRILVTGREGQVVSALREAAPAGVELVAAGRPELDLLDPHSVHAAIRGRVPDVVVSAAAYTAVDRAEDEPELAGAVNAAGAEAVAAAAASLGAPVIHLSTDYVFPGKGDEPHAETDPTGPGSVYGRTKLEGERRVAAANPQHVILRTAWVYSPFGRNFVRTMLALAASRDEIAVVADQWGNPTSAADLADGILHIAAAIARGEGRFGTFHLAGSGSTNWSGLAEHVLRASARLGGPTARVRPIATTDYPTRAARPANSRLLTDALAQAYGWRAPDWRNSSEAVVGRLVGKGA